MKTNNNRKYPNSHRQPHHIDHLRKADAEARQTEYDKLSLEQKLARLPAEPACAKQRAKLLLRLEKLNSAKTAVETIKTRKSTENQPT